MMNPFHNLSRETLLQRLTEYYNNYRNILELGGSEEEYARCKLGLDAILKELNNRKNQAQELTEQRRDYNFTRYR